MEEAPKRHSCYILYNDTNAMTYNGYTVDPQRRLRQHNGVIRGGARYTQRAREKHGVQEWKVLALVSCPDGAAGFDKRKALSLEWHIRYPTNRKPRPKAFNGPEGRLRGLHMALAHPKFSGIPLDVSVCIHWQENKKIAAHVDATPLRY